MKLLLDDNLSHKLIAKLRDLYDLTHTSRHNLSKYGDELIWKFCLENDLTIVSRDEDFVARVTRYGYPPRVIWIRIGHAKTSIIERCLRGNFEAIKAFHESDKGVLELRDFQT